MPLPRSYHAALHHLADLALLATAQSMDAKRLRAALEQTFAFRNTHALPVSVPAPAEEWRAPY
jgi:hypothetical protein